LCLSIKTCVKLHFFVASENHFKGLEVASSSYHKILEENRALYNQVQDLKGVHLNFLIFNLIIYMFYQMWSLANEIGFLQEPLGFIVELGPSYQGNQMGILL
jgi:hypothetical protein